MFEGIYEKHYPTIAVEYSPSRDDLVDMINNQFAELLKLKFYPTVTVEYSPTKEEWEEIKSGSPRSRIDTSTQIKTTLNVGTPLSIRILRLSFIMSSESSWDDDDEVDNRVKAFDVIVDGINLLDPDRQRMALTVSELGQLDANDYDYIIQLGVFGKEVYC